MKRLLITVALLSLLRVFPFHAPTHAEPLGKLFFSPEQRAALEQLRQTPQATAGRAEAVERITVNGVVRRSSGPDTVWINGVPQTSAPDNRSTRLGTSPAAVNVKVSGRGKEQSVKVGQTLEMSQGTVADVPIPDQPPSPSITVQKRPD